VSCTGLRRLLWSPMELRWPAALRDQLQEGRARRDGKGGLRAALIVLGYPAAAGDRTSSRLPSHPRPGANEERKHEAPSAINGLVPQPVGKRIQTDQQARRQAATHRRRRNRYPEPACQTSNRRGAELFRSYPGRMHSEERAARPLRRSDRENTRDRLCRSCRVEPSSVLTQRGRRQIYEISKIIQLYGLIRSLHVSQGLIATPVTVVVAAGPHSMADPPARPAGQFCQETVVKINEIDHTILGTARSRGLSPVLVTRGEDPP
jgi:hypothetical protein